MTAAVESAARGDESSGTAPVISVRDLWMVFGPKPGAVPPDPAEAIWPEAVEPRLESTKSPAGKSPAGPAPVAPVKLSA